MSLLMYAKLIWLCTRVGVLSNSVSNGEIIFSPLRTFSNYSLANFTSETLKGVWSLDPYVNVARGFILGLVDYKKIQGTYNYSLLLGALDLLHRICQNRRRQSILNCVL